MGPKLSKVGERMSPESAVDQRVAVGLKPTAPTQAAGILIPPKVSVARETGTTPEATAPAEPPLEPPQVLSVSIGFLALPKNMFFVIVLKPSSAIVVLPAEIAPKCFNRFHRLPSLYTLFSKSALHPAVTGT